MKLVRREEARKGVCTATAMFTDAAVGYFISWLYIHVTNGKDSNVFDLNAPKPSASLTVTLYLMPVALGL